MIYGDLKLRFWTPLSITGGVFLLLGNTVVHQGIGEARIGRRP